MRQYHFAAAMLLAFILSGCGGGGAGNQAPKVNFTSQVSFGDSLSDVGSYAVSGVAAAGGGQFTVNVTGAKNNWTELMAAQIGRTASSCAAVTGGNGAPTQAHGGCYAYAQGGALVSGDAGIGNKDGGYLTPGTAYTGAMTLSVTRQIAAHLAAAGGSFSGTEIVYVLAGANDIFVQLGGLQAGATAAATAAVTAAVPAQVPLEIANGKCLASEAATVCVSAAIATLTPTVGAAAAAAYVQANAPAAATAVGTEAVKLTTLVTSQIIANGAKYVVVVNVPDVASTPFAAGAEAASPGTRALIDTLVTTFNTQLKTQLANNTNVLLVDAYTINHDQVVNPAIYGLTNVTGTACDVSKTGWLATHGFANSTGEGSSLGCNAANPASMTAGVSGDSHYLFADGVHPTPYGYWLLARYVSKEMLVKGWL